MPNLEKSRRSMAKLYQIMKIRGGGGNEFKLKGSPLCTEKGHNINKFKYF